MNILHITDFHYSEETKALADVVSAIVDALEKITEKIDFVLFTGDLVQNGTIKADYSKAVNALFGPILQTMDIIADTCFGIYLYDASDHNHIWAEDTWNELNRGNKFLVPYPTMYEFINTKLMWKKENVEFFKRLFENENLLQRISDEEYKDEALQLSLQWTDRTISLVDHTIRLMLEDDKIKKRALITLNVKDFVDVCRSKNIQLIYCEK